LGGSPPPSAQDRPHDSVSISPPMTPRKTRYESETARSAWPIRRSQRNTSTPTIEPIAPPLASTPPILKSTARFLL
jgi:hypothetical protein